MFFISFDRRTTTLLKSPPIQEAMTGFRATSSIVLRKAFVVARAARDPSPPLQNSGDQLIMNTLSAPPYQDLFHPPLFIGSVLEFQQCKFSFRTSSLILF